MLEAVENLLSVGFTPARDVYLSFGGNEETYGDAAASIATALNERGIVPWLVLDEGGAVVDAPLPFALGSAAMVGVGEKGVVTLRLSARGDGGHASTPPRITAVGRIARAIDRLDAGTFPARTPAAITRMLSLFANKARGRDQTVLRTLATFPAADRADLRGDGRRAVGAGAHDRRRDHAAGRHRRQRAALAGVGDAQPAHRARRDGAPARSGA